MKLLKMIGHYFFSSLLQYAKKRVFKKMELSMTGRKRDGREAET